jgi:hypothetical protein
MVHVVLTCTLRRLIDRHTWDASISPLIENNTWKMKSCSIFRSAFGVLFHHFAAFICNHSLSGHLSHLFLGGQPSFLQQHSGHLDSRGQTPLPKHAGNTRRNKGKYYKLLILQCALNQLLTKCLFFSPLFLEIFSFAISPKIVWLHSLTHHTITPLPCRQTILNAYIC